MKNIYNILFISILNHLFLLAQINDTIHLQSIEIAASPFQLKDNQFKAGKKIQNIDSLIQQVYSINPLSELLNYQTSVFVKNYSPGSISSTSIRGGNAQQTMILWNGVNINHPMLGQADFSQYPTGLFDNISIEYGASTSLWGSGAVNGTVRLENTFEKNNYLSYRFGSFNTHQILNKTNWNVNNFQFQIKPYYHTSHNNYRINDTLQLKNANFTSKGILLSTAYRWNQHHQVQFHSWYNQNNRNIPNNYFFNYHASQQLDKNFRNVLDYTYSKSSWKTVIKLAYINDILNYTDTLANVHSYSNVHTFQTDAGIYKQILPNLQLLVGHQWIYNLALTNNYLNNEILNRQALYAGINHHIKKIKYNMIIRKEWADIKSIIPITGNTGISIDLNPFLAFKIQVSTFYRLPTLNDLYWRGSGDITLKPESGYQYEGGVIFNIKIKSFHSELFSELTAFNKYTDNWIIWLAGGNGQPVPANLLNVWSRGTETNNYLSIHYKKGKIKIGVSSAYILSTIEKSEMNNDASIGRQLIYTPRYNINGNVQLSYKNAFLLFTHQYVGYRFTSSDNLQYIEPYYIANISTGYTLSYKKITMQFILGSNNILNTHYMIVAQKPMPLRHYFIQINILQHKTHNNSII